MAYAALIILAQLLEQISNRDQFLYIPLSDEEQILKSLHEKMGLLQAFLDNYSHKAGETVLYLEARIRDAAYQAQDIIEFHISDRIRSYYESSGVNKGFLQLVSSTIQKVERRRIQYKYEKELLKALEQIDSIVKEVMNIQISCRVEEGQISHTSALATSSVAPNGRNKMVGFDEDLIDIKARLCGESSRLQIIPIVGMGGIGKTTLARNIFDDSLIAYHFHFRAWITISQEYRLRDILLGLQDSLPVTTKDLSKTNEQLMEYVYKCLKGRTYLIIMDDMWNPEAWDDLRRIFPNDNNGSRIVITTRLTHVAEYASSSPIHRMHFLNRDQSWKLLREKVFVEQSCPPELEKIGRMVAKNCGGLPLAVAVVAGILKKVDRTQYHWENIAENISLAMATTDEHLSKVLTLSYDHLPSHLKACFLYMGGFPEDHEIHVSRLIMLWVGEGFLKPIGSKSLEEVAEEYLEDLVKRNLVLITKKRSNGKFRFCGIHDLLRDLCIRKAREEKFLDVYTSGREVANLHRLTICSHVDIECVITNTCASSSPIRSVLHFGVDKESFSFVLRLRLLRVLDAPKTELDCFPVEITELFHLRYLAFAYCNTIVEPQMLPPALSKLQNLQTLIIDCLRYSMPLIPFQIWKFPQLRHLILRGSTFIIPLVARIDGHLPVLENLHTLCGVVNFNLTSEALDMIPNLKKLKVQYTGVSRAKSSKSLVHLHQLEKLNLEFNLIRGQRHFRESCYALPPNLKKLTLIGARPPSEDMSIIGLLPNLQVLKLLNFDFVEEYWESNEGEFPRLKFLLIYMSNLVRWRVERTNFPCLQHLIIRYCESLKEIPDAIGDIPTLDLIEVGPGSKSAADSAVLIQEEQQSLGNDILQVRIY